MSDDVRISVGLPNHPKTKKLKRRVGGDGCWSLIVLFLWVGAEKWDGDLSGMSDEDIELAAGWDGEPGALVAALLEVRFMVGDAFTRRIHEWQEHNPYAATKGQRIAKGKRAAEARWNKVKDATGMPEACSEHAASIAEQCPPAPAPAPTYSSTDRSGESVGALVMEGQFEGHAEPKSTPNPAAAFAIALLAEGFQATAMNAHLVAYVQEGGTVQHLQQVMGLKKCKGKSAEYVIAVARGELAEKVDPMQARTTGEQHATHRTRESHAERAERINRQHDERERQAG